VACLVRSQEGAGKTSFWEWFGKFVLGQKYYLPARMDQVIKKFNSIAANNLFMVFEETKNGKGMKFHEELKQMITDEWQVIEPKGVDSYKTRSYTNYVILTNEHYPVKLTANDRRFFYLEADNKHKADRKYWINLFTHFKDNGAATGVWNEKSELHIHTEILYNVFKMWENSTDVKIKTMQMAFSKLINEVQKSDRIEITSAGKKKRAMGFNYR
jgi:hypothetical protein